MIGCLRTRVQKQPIIALYLELKINSSFITLRSCGTDRNKWFLCHKDKDEMFPCVKKGVSGFTTIEFVEHFIQFEKNIECLYFS